MSLDRKVSVIMPCYNGAENIVDAIESFLGQTYDNKELIIVDGKSTDGSHEIIAKYCIENSNIIWLNVNDSCVTDAINIGIQHSTAHFIGFLMTDDRYCYADFFLECTQLSNNIDFDILFSNTYYYLTHTDKRTIYYWRPGGDIDRKKMLTKGSSIAIIDSTIVKRSVFNNNLLDPEYNLCSDYDFFLRLADGNTLFIYLDIFTTACLYKGNNLSAKNNYVQTKMFSKVSIKFLVDLEEDDYFLYHEMLYGSYIQNPEIKDAENVLIKLLQANNEKGFYDRDFFHDYIINLWKKVHINSKMNKLKRVYSQHSSFLYNNGINSNKNLLFAKWVWRKLKSKI